jgi:hypothetical protein
MVDASLVVNLVELGVLVVGVIVALLQLRDIKQTRETELETRQAQLYMQFLDTFNNKEFTEQWLDVIHNWTWSDYDDFQEKYGPKKNMESYSAFVSVAMYFSGLGILVEKGLIDIDFVYRLSPTALRHYWEKTEPIVYRLREETNSTHLQRYFEYLYNEIMKYIEEHPESNP